MSGFLPQQRFLVDIAQDYEDYAGDDEGDAEQLSHIQFHPHLEIHLRQFDELYDETYSETSRHKGSEEPSAMDMVAPAPVFPEQHEAENEV